MTTEHPDDELAWTVEDRETAYECPGFDIIREDVILPDGTRTDFDFLSDPPSVVILPFLPNGDVVVIEEWRQAVKRVNLGLPAGTAEPDDRDLTSAARRELLEETGYDAGRIEPLGTFEPANGLADTHHHYFLAHECTHTGEPTHDADESIRVRVMGYEELWEAVVDGTLQDGRTALGVLYHRATSGPS